MSADWTLPDSGQKCPAAVPRQIEIKQDDVRARQLCPVDVVDVPKHALALTMARQPSFNAVVRQRLFHKKDVSGTILDQYDLELAARPLTRILLRRV